MRGWIKRALKYTGLHPRDPALIQLLNLGSESSSGVMVDESVMLSGTAVLQGIRIISEGVGMLPLVLYRRLERGKARATEHSLYARLHRNPNPEQTIAEFKERMQASAIVYGRAYAQLVLRGDGQVAEMWQLYSHRMRREKKNGVVRYLYTTDNGVSVLRPEEVFQINGFNLNGIMGLKLLEVGGETIGHGEALRRYGSKLFRNGALSRGFMSTAGKLSPEAAQRRSEEISAQYGGLENSHKIAIFGEKMEWQNMGIPPNDAQWIESRRFNVLEVARLLNIKPHLLMDLERATFSNIEAQGEEHVRYTLNPWLVKWEERISLDMLPEAERGTYFAEFMRDALLRGDTIARFQAYQIGIQSGIMTRNEVREKENLNPLDGLDEPLQPLNMIPVGQKPLPPKQQNDMPEMPEMPDNMKPIRGQNRSIEVRAQARVRVRDAFRPVFRDAAQRLVKREVREIRKRLADEKRDAASDLSVWLEDFYQKFGPAVRDNMQAAVQSMAAAVAAAALADIGDLTQVQLAAAVDNYLGALSARYTGSSLGQLRSLLDSDDFQGAVEGRLTEWLDKRPNKIGNRETTQLEGYVSREALKQAGVTKFRWVAIGQTCPICMEIDGRIVGSESPFVYEGEWLNPNEPKQPREEDTKISLKSRHNVFHPPLHDGCDCIILPE